MIGFEALNDMQKKAVLQTEGPVLILAGAGSGKTGALTVRIAHLLETGVKPWNILAITFTNKAAKEMRERVEKLVGDTARDMWISTFHSTCVRILRREIQHLDYENQFSIYDSDDQEKIMREAFKRLNMSTTDKSFSVKGAMSIISHLKEEMTSWEDYAQHVDKNDLKAVRIAKVYQTYQKMLKENNALDFDDLIYKTVLLFRQFPDVLEKYQEDSAISWWTNIRIRIQASMSWWQCLRRNIKTSAWSGMMTRAFTAGVGQISAIFWILKRISPIQP